MNLTKMKKKKGFTLIELMAVIAIIAILAAVLVPTVSGYITRSKKTAIITQVRTIVNAVESYNATSTSGINDNDQLGSPTGTDTAANKLVNAELIAAGDINKLNTSVTIGMYKRINADSDALNKITYDTSSKVFKYDSNTISTAVN